MRAKTGFTLIELLIVIAIILILIAIALPNFLEAQIRAKVAKSAGDVRTLGIAVESFRLDRNMLLVDIWDDDSPSGLERLFTQFGNIGNSSKSSRLASDVLKPLTTPVQYITEIPMDPFLEDPPAIARSETWEGQTDTYTYFDREKKIEDSRWLDDHNLIAFHPGASPYTLGVKRLSEEEFGIMGAGPDGQVTQSQNALHPRGLSYSATNGTRSNGQLIWRSGFGTMANQ
ncbi:MAG: prepilin-type N-terminal cleavage/methylation domain-containing protein [Candidatus Omnitrophica bacterium]|nr:prepilin-type N-terminal cleavage/methylation domain-containing protein [Candidatus Omnitrophota bacterium]MCA9424644.1 prepilin-type N-terminal cleavage/methylation domain-containing protein [Candidatus Omnitrophota bacterium]MCA9432419.1 prepilin-type N-terminal cleavage/methylation domain-containing protein [Candidatus Omnitrophota bacterium]MCA9436498.1 prepilin-type N-terminal cleavage/methylation domain-containing protein [Candidatus Omnitrophota bacterium]MCA9439602.1 prepilin-type N-